MGFYTIMMMCGVHIYGIQAQNITLSLFAYIIQAKTSTRRFFQLNSLRHQSLDTLTQKPLITLNNLTLPFYSSILFIFM